MSQPFRLTQFTGGQPRLRQTDNAADYLRCLVDEMANDFCVDCDVIVGEGAAGRLWIILRRPPRLNRPSGLRFSELCAALDKAFEAHYEILANGRGPGARGWDVRHRDGRPWL